MTRKLTRIVLASAALVVISVPAFAAGGSAGAPSWGPRFGVSVDPDQLVIGGQYSTGQIAPSISFVPNLELGFGDHQTDVAINLDGHYHFKLNDSDWAPYLGFGVCIDFVSFDRPAPAEDDSETNAGGQLILGSNVPLREGSKFFAELKLGLGDIPSLKVMAGWNFPL
jgi:hypothetical protein